MLYDSDDTQKPLEESYGNSVFYDVFNIERHKYFSREWPFFNDHTESGNLESCFAENPDKRVSKIQVAHFKKKKTEIDIVRMIC